MAADAEKIFCKVGGLAGYKFNRMGIFFQSLWWGPDFSRFFDPWGFLFACECTVCQQVFKGYTVA